MASPLVALPLVMAGGFALAEMFFKWKKGNLHTKHVPDFVFDKFGKLKDIEGFGDYFGKICMCGG